MPAPRSRYAESTMKSSRASLALKSPLGVPFERFGLLEELMRAVDLVTLAEREQVMNKMLVIVRGEALGLDSPIAAADLASLSNAMTELEHEAGRSAPASRP